MHEWSIWYQNRNISHQSKNIIKSQSWEWHKQSQPLKALKECRREQYKTNAISPSAYYWFRQK